MILNGISAWVSIESGSRLAEYQTRKTDDSTIECWIPSTQNTNFEIWFDIPTEIRPGFALMCYPRLDGIDYPGTIQPSVRRAMGKSSVCIRGEATSPRSIRLFAFGSRNLTADDKHLPAGDDLETLKQELNTVRLLFQWGNENVKTKPQTEFSLPQGHGRVHEKAVKKGYESSNAELGSTTSTLESRQMLYIFRPVLPLKPLMFVFRYSPEDWLQAKGIIPSKLISSQKRRHSTLPEVIDADAREVIEIDDLESDDEEIQIIRHTIPVTTPPPASKRQKVKEEGD